MKWYPFIIGSQGRQSFVPDIGPVIPTIKSDRAGQPGVEPRGDGLYGVCALECMLASPLCHMDHIYYFNLWWELFFSFGALLARLILVFAWCLFPFVFGV